MGILVHRGQSLDLRLMMCHKNQTWEKLALDNIWEANEL